MLRFVLFLFTCLWFYNCDWKLWKKVQHLGLNPGPHGEEPNQTMYHFRIKVPAVMPDEWMNENQPIFPSLIRTIPYKIRTCNVCTAACPCSLLLKLLSYLHLNHHSSHLTSLEVTSHVRLCKTGPSETKPNQNNTNWVFFVLVEVCLFIHVCVYMCLGSQNGWCKLWKKNHQLGLNSGPHGSYSILG